MFKIWKIKLNQYLDKFFLFKRNTTYFRVKLSLFFVLVNILFYWFAMILAFPELLKGPSSKEYFLLQFPVGILGGFFDSLSLVITIIMVKRALLTTSNISYIAHLSIDILIAIAATFWVLLVFSFSGWVVSFLTLNPENLIQRTEVYEERFVSALRDPTGKDEIKNIFFGIMMGCSAMLPTTFHIFLFFQSVVKYLRRKKY